ncbi:hypothetical protein HNQ47_000161 [Catenisphaera adipataccumulans]|uniref:Uncharacterized protein n=1 Tax=Catenisphaera adipataccumulans TaxID=700500 RepID=A0A7W8CV60_9FIRM|nr:hypothetical protein [Catenisphaera adipataccumulans]
MNDFVSFAAMNIQRKSSTPNQGDRIVSQDE